MAGVLYTDEQLNRLTENENILSDVVKTTHEKFTRNKDNRDARLLIEAINASNESIHKQASNKAKMEQIKSNDETKDLVADMLMAITTQSTLHRITDHRDIIDTQIILPMDIVEGEIFIGPGNLELEDVKGDDE